MFALWALRAPRTFFPAGCCNQCDPQHLKLKHKHKIDRLDTKPIPEDSSEVYCVMCIQNEMLRLPWVLEYHRNLGINRFFIIDNGSSDGSTEYLFEQPDVHLFYTKDSYGESSFGISWLNLVLDHFCTGHWCVVIDADELLIYPHCEKIHIKLLCEYLDTFNARAVYTRMFDMYSDKPISEINYSAGEPFQLACQYFDGDGYSVVQTPRLFPDYQLYGGVRKRVFWDGQLEKSLPPVLTKLALVKWDKSQKYLLSTHIMTPVVLAELSGALLHYKFLDDFHKKSSEAANTDVQFDRSREYSVYARMLKSNPSLSFYYSGSVRYNNSYQMIDMGFMKCPISFNKYINNRD